MVWWFVFKSSFHVSSPPPGYTSLRAGVPSIMCGPIFSESLHLLVDTIAQPGVQKPLTLGAQTNTSIIPRSKWVGSLGAWIFQFGVKIHIHVESVITSLPSLGIATGRLACLLESRGRRCVLLQADLAVSVSRR